MHHRGRSRLVSPVALARLASEERGHTHAETRPMQDTPHESQRTRRLRACEQRWEDEPSRLVDEQCRAIQRREHDAALLRAQTRSRPKWDPDPFQYACMPPSTSTTKSAKKSSTCHHRAVSFKEVIHAMNGPLFPLDASERADGARRIAGLPIPNTTPQRRRASVRAELLNSLLHVVEWQQGERRKAKGKDVDRSPLLKPLPLPPTPMLAVPSSLSTTSLSSSRSSSWLSFGSWRSSATDVTTPDSPLLPSPTSQPCRLPTLVENQRDLHPRCAFVRISLEESPLSPPVLSHALARDDHACVIPPGPPPLGIRGTLVKRVARSVTSVVEVAKGIQSAYMTATMFTAGPPCRDPCPSRCVRREGYRALPNDVRTFTDATTPISQTCEPVHFIPLASPPSGNAGLPKPLVPKDTIIFPSPLRPRTPPVSLAYRMRPVANPAVLRLKALQNLMYARGKQWEGRARDGALGCGKERMLGIAFEGRGRSGLGCEVRFVVA